MPGDLERLPARVWPAAAPGRAWRVVTAELLVRMRAELPVIGERRTFPLHNASEIKRGRLSRGLSAYVAV